jgi:GDPmannose 4,6-dehydratase
LKTALIIGVGGQDGTYLAKFLLSKNYEVFGSSRDASTNSFSNLKLLNIRNEIKLVSLNLADYRSTLHIIAKIEPDEIYNLSSQSSVALSFEQPVETIESIVLGSLNLLEAIRFLKIECKIYFAGSSECFGEMQENPANENTAFKPRSPYAVSKAASYWEVNNYRESYGIFAATGILFNHESPLRPNRFVTRKIISTACSIYKGASSKLELGNISIERDWGWAPEYVEAMWKILQHNTAEDFVIGTGKTVSLRYFIDYAFKALGLDYNEYIIQNEELYRPSDLKIGRADPSKAKNILGWEAKFSVEDVINKMIDFELNGNIK